MRTAWILGVVILGALFAGCQSLSPLTVKQASVNDVALRYLDQGQGQVVLMVHGAIADHRIWEMQRAIIAKNYRFVALDQRYFGNGPWLDNGSKYSLSTHLDDLAAFIKALNAGPVDLVGWSYGGSLGLALAAQHPQLVRSLFLYEPALPTVVTDATDQQALAEERKGLGPAVAAAKANDYPGAVRRFAEWVNNQKTGEFENGTPAWVSPILLDNARTVPLLLAAPPPPPITCAQVGQIKVPVVIAKGQQTRPFFNILADTTSRCIPGSRLITIPDSTHSGPVQNPGAFNDAVLTFLAKR